MAEWEQGRGPSPALILALVQRLPEASLTKALVQGNEALSGWGVEEYALASIYNAINENTRATGNWKKKPPKIEAFPVPKPKKKKSIKRTAKEMMGAFMRR